MLFACGGMLLISLVARIPNPTSKFCYHVRFVKYSLICNEKEEDEEGIFSSPKGMESAWIQVYIFKVSGSVVIIVPF